MKTDHELEQIVDTIRPPTSGYPLRSDYIGPYVKLLRSIQIDALRHAKEMLDQSQTETPVSDLAELIRELELR